jgi:hypothetical protein
MVGPLVTELFPVARVYPREGINNSGIELNTTECKYFFEGVLVTSTTSIDAI